MGGLFELNVYHALEKTFPPAEPQPKLPSSRKRSDVRVKIDDVTVFIEATVLGEAQYWTGVRNSMRAAGQTSWAGPGPGPVHGAQRVLTKIGEELSQTADGYPNILCLSFFDWNPTPEARKWAIEDAWLGGARFGARRNGTQVDLSRLDRIDSIFEFGRNRLRTIHMNPVTTRASKLTNELRSRIETAFQAELMIR